MDRLNAETIQNSLSAGSKKLLTHFCNSLSRDCNDDCFDDRMYDLLKEYALHTESIDFVRGGCNKVGYSQSRKESKQLDAQIDSFCSQDYTSFRWNRNYRESKRLMKKYFSKFHLKPLIYKNDTDIRDAIPKEGTHSGWSFIETGLRLKGEYLDGCFETLTLKIKNALECGTFNTIILPGVRTQCQNAFDDEGKLASEMVKHKTRLVSMIDVYQIMVELKWAKPLQKVLSNVSWYAGGKNDFRLDYCIDASRNRCYKWISLDYSKYDQSISSWLIEDAFEIIRCAFDDLDDERLFDVMVNDFINKVFVDRNGVLHEAHKGVPSGSMFTQIIDSIVNYLMVQTYFLSINKEFDSYIMGDDNLIFVRFDLDKSEICSYLTKNFGIIVNNDKSSDGYKNDDPEFLSRFWTRQGPWRHPYILASKLMFPERYRNYKRVSPELVLYSYILAYKKGMSELIDVDRFLKLHKFKFEEVLEKGTKYLPGYIGYYYQYILAA